MSTYYASSPTQVFAAELEEGLLTLKQAEAICSTQAQEGPITKDK